MTNPQEYNKYHAFIDICRAKGLALEKLAWILEVDVSDLYFELKRNDVKNRHFWDKCLRLKSDLIQGIETLWAEELADYFVN